MPYEILKRMIRGTSSPELDINIDFKYINYKSEINSWEIPLTLINNSNYPAKNTKILIHIPKQENLSEVNAPGYRDVSAINRFNPKGYYFSENVEGNIYRGLSLSLKPINIKMVNKKIKVSFNASIYSEGMVAKVFNIDIYLSKSGVPGVKIKGEPLY